MGEMFIGKGQESDLAPIEKKTPEQLLGELKTRLESIISSERAPGDDAIVRQLEGQIAVLESSINKK